MTTVTIERDAGTMPGHLAVPTGEGPWPGVVVVHDALGMTSDLRNQAEWLAASGYLAIAPDLYYWGSRPRCLFATLRDFTEGRGRAFDDLDAARRLLVERDDCTGRVGVIGFCMGGGFALALATTGDYGSSSVNYGAFDDRLAERLGDACPIVASYGGRDRSLRDVPVRLREILEANDIEHDIEVYPEAGHGFLNNHVPGELPWWARLAGLLVSTAYHEPSALEARARILAFFGRHLADD